MGITASVQPGSADEGPAITLPRGGGAVRGIGEKFATNPVTGTGAVSVPVPVSPGRGGFGPELALGYDSGAGRGVFGMGWSVTLPSITRRTDLGVPAYDDTDVFLLSGSEDLVPVRRPNGTPDVRFRQDGPVRYRVQRYRPRTEGLFARIERWTRVGGGSETHWRTISRDNVTTRYGVDDDSRIADPAAAERCYSWLISECFDGKGNAVEYGYKREDAIEVDLVQAHERRRPAAARTTGRHLKWIRYGNRVSRLDEARFPSTEWMFELVLDYGEHDLHDPRPGDTGRWPCRADPFSSYRSGFEVRTYRLCRRILMFHHFSQEPGVGADCLVRSLDLTYAADPVASFLASATVTGHRRGEDGPVAAAMPPIEFGYTELQVDDTLHTVSPDDVAGLPIGIDGGRYQLADLDGDGLSDVLTEQSGAWLAKRGLGDGRFARVGAVAMPSTASAGSPRLLDLAGDGRLDLVRFDGDAVGFAERTAEGGWQPPVPFASVANVDWADPQMRLADLTGDGRPDLLRTEGGAMVWHPALGEDGFGPARRVSVGADEDAGPALVFADGTQSIFVSDMSGDGVGDLVRIREHEVCYWPGLGGGRFGAKVIMDSPPLLDGHGQFDPRRVLLGDVDGTGPQDVIYLGADGVRVWFNQSGNRWGPARRLSAAPPVDDAVTVTVSDLLGTGTACLVWSSPLPADVGRPLRYLDLMGGRKPHLLTSVVNNLGAETVVSYAPSTRWSRADEAAGRPWITSLPFPVHVVERVVTEDRVSRNRHVSRFAYHHGFFDGAEREFRGFGLVEQWDTAEFGAFSADGQLPVPDNADPASHVPPVLTRTWYHTGAYLEAAGMARHYTTEYYPDAALLPDTILPDTILSADGSRLPYVLTADEQRDACRALRGTVLRQEVYAVDGTAAQDRPYLVTESCHRLELVQPEHRDGPVRSPAVLFAHPRETLTSHYERALYEVPGRAEPVADPRVGHDLVLDVDPFGNVLASATVFYGRRWPDPQLSQPDCDVQATTLVTYVENWVTNAVPPVPADVGGSEVTDSHRSPASFAARTFELTGYRPTGPSGRYRPADFYAPPGNSRVRRLLGHSRSRWRSDDLATLLAPGVLEALALPGESHRLAFGSDLVAAVFGADRLADPPGVLGDAGPAGGGYADLDGDGNWWLPATRTFFAPEGADELADARDHFFLPVRHRDPFGHDTAVTFDDYDLMPCRIEDPVGNVVTGVNDYRVLQPALITDPNGNRSAVAFTAFGLVAGTAIMGKPDAPEGDTLDGFDPDLTPAAVLADPRAALAGATTRMAYDLAAYRDGGTPIGVLTLLREVHHADPGGDRTPIQTSFSYSDGFGREVQTKVRAEAGPVPRRDAAGDVVLDADGRPSMTAGDVEPRWVANGWTVFNNKGKPVRSYEPFFTDRHTFEFGVRAGVSPVLFYDPAERVVATLNPDDSYAKVVFDPWRQDTFDANDTVAGDPRTDPQVGGLVREYFAGQPGWQPWRVPRQLPGADPAEKAAADKALVHAGTPTTACLDAAGRSFCTVTRNRLVRDGATVTETLTSRVRLDARGRQSEVYDATDRLVMSFDYDLNDRVIRQTGMDAGSRWTLDDAAGKPIRRWDSMGRVTTTEYDDLRRPERVWVSGIVTELISYGEEHPEATSRNLRGRPWRHADQAGVAGTEENDFKGNVMRRSRRLARDVDGPLDWQAFDTVPLEAETFTTADSYDACNRVVATTAPDGSVLRRTFNAAGLLETVAAELAGAAEPTAFVTAVDYDEHRRRRSISYGNGTVTGYEYDRLTGRLTGLTTLRPEAGFPDDCPQPPPVDWPGCGLQRLRYTYDPAGNITHFEDGAQQAVFFRNKYVRPGADYVYDALYRLIEATGREHLGQVGGAPIPHSHDDAPRVGIAWADNDGDAMGTYTERYVYDAAGNVRELQHRGADPAAPGWTRSFECETTSNRLRRIVGGGTFRYDVHGNAIRLPHLGGTDPEPNVTWTHLDQLHGVDLGGGGTAVYAYDSGGKRVRKVWRKAPGRTEERIYLGGFEIFRWRDGTGKIRLERQTLHVMDDQARVALVEIRTAGTADDDPAPAKTIRYQVTDVRESAVLELDDKARIISYEEYTPYGSTAYQAVRSGTETPKRYRFTGKERDEETGLAYHDARYYAPWLCRWVSADPANLAGGLNLYAYVRGDPIGSIDPDGTREFKLGSFAKGALFAGAGILLVVAVVATAGAAAPMVGGGAAMLLGAGAEAAGGAAVFASGVFEAGVLTLGVVGAKELAENSAAAFEGVDPVTGEQLKDDQWSEALGGALVGYLAMGASRVMESFTSSGKAPTVETRAQRQSAWIESSLAEQRAAHTIHTEEFQVAARTRADADDYSAVIRRASVDDVTRADRPKSFGKAAMASNWGPVSTNASEIAVVDNTAFKLNVQRGPAPPKAEVQRALDSLLPVVRERIALLPAYIAELEATGRMTPELRGKIDRAGIAGTHSDVLAVNQVLAVRAERLGRPATVADFASVVVVNRNLSGPLMGQLAPPPCFNCSFILSGVKWGR